MFYRGQKFVTAVAALLFLISATGCVHRRMTIESVPPQALVVVDGEEIGKTPISIDFTYYGTREIKLVKDGYESKTFEQAIPAPWYQIPPLDLISDNFAMGQIPDRRRFVYQLQPKAVPQSQSEGLLNRAQSLRSESALGSGF